MALLAATKMYKLFGLIINFTKLSNNNVLMDKLNVNIYYFSYSSKQYVKLIISNPIVIYNLMATEIVIAASKHNYFETMPQC